MSRTVGRIGLVSELLRRGISPNYADDGILVVNQKCIRPDGVLDLQYSRRHDEADREIPEELLIQPGDILINSTGTGTLGRSCVVREVETRMTWDSHVTLVRPRQQKVHYSYLGWVIESEEQQLIELSVGSTNQIELSRGTVFNLEISLPPLETQQRIADYLDRETAEIDAAVADLDRYVDLLEQRRLLTVDEVLYFLKAAASEWPEMSLKFIIKERFVGDWGEETGTADIDAPCVRVADFDRPTNTVGDQVPTIRSYSLDKYEAKRLRHHDILVERSGGGEKTPVGSAMLYTGGDEVLCANFIEVVRLKEDQLPEYWVHVLRREYMGRNTMRFVKQTTGIQNLDPQGFYDQKFPVPSLDTQIKLANELRERTSEIDYLIAESKKLRDLLLKRRSVLITEVVTGRKQV